MKASASPPTNCRAWANASIAPTRPAQRGGHGLGLAIAQSLIHAHGGELWLESEEGVGTTASFTLPHDVGARHSSLRL